MIIIAVAPMSTSSTHPAQIPCFSHRIYASPLKHLLLLLLWISYCSQQTQAFSVVPPPIWTPSPISSSITKFTTTTTLGGAPPPHWHYHSSSSHSSSWQQQQPLWKLPALQLSTSSSIPEGLSSTLNNQIDKSIIETTATTTTTKATTTDENNKVKPWPGSIVTIECQLIPNSKDHSKRNKNVVVNPFLIDGIVENENDVLVPLTFVLNQGNYIPALHNLISNMTYIGQVISNVMIDGGYGPINPNLIATISFNDLSLSGGGIAPSQIQLGTSLVMSNGLTCVVTNVNNTHFTIDANPPLAGTTFCANVKLLNVEPGPSIAATTTTTPAMTTTGSTSITTSSKYEVATFALGCFWGGELAYMREPGVVGTKVGYINGQIPYPTYEQVCSGKTGHTEAIQVVYDPNVVTYQRLVQLAMDRLGNSKYFLNQVGNDKGTQYRHGIYYHTPDQEQIAKEVLSPYGSDCVTECVAAQCFYDAEEYHQQYLLKGGQSARKNDESVIRCYG